MFSQSIFAHFQYKIQSENDHRHIKDTIKVPIDM